VVGTRRKHVPLRRCVACGEQRQKRELVRLVRAEGGWIEVDAAPKAAGRGAYVCRTGECLNQAAEGKQISRSLKIPVPQEAAARIKEMARRASRVKKDAGR
jgi:predicted RNA-binding protein YlxR (DUF448 family)